MRCLLLALVLACTAGCQPGDDGTDPAAAGNGERGSPLERALGDADIYRLRIDCTGDDGARSLEVFDDGTAIWNSRQELQLSAPERRELAHLLLAGGFAELGAEYGGKPLPDRAKAPARLICSIALDIGDLSKRSQQFADGEQSARLLALADEVLDAVGTLAADRGVGAESLADGLAKVADGRLSPHAFRLRLVRTPAEGAGRITEIVDGRLRVQPYEPGSRIGPVRTEALGESELAHLARGLRAAGLAEMPINLWSDSPLELRVSVLDHRVTRIAREFTRLRHDTLGEAQQRFNNLVERLDALSENPTKD